MPSQLPKRDPIAASRRKTAAVRRVGIDARCACGEQRPEALVPGTKPIQCARCQRKQKGKSVIDQHHFAGKSNDSLTIPIDVNDHRAEVSVDQQDWPKRTLENPDGSPFLRAAACIRGFCDTLILLIKKGLHWIAEMLELADSVLTEELGKYWWVDKGLERFEPKKKRDK